MPRWSLETGCAHLRDAMDDLQIAWRETNELWQDEVSQKFCQNYLEPVGPALKQALEAAGRMQQLMNEIQRECDEHDERTVV